MADVSSITTQITSLSNLLLVSPQNTVGYQPQASGSLKAAGNPIVFNYEGEQTSVLESDITDHYIEDNTAIQDQIAIRPEIITTHGYIGELNDIAPFFLQNLQSLANKLTIVSGYFPQFSVTALNAYNEAVFASDTALSAANSAISTIESLAGVFTGSNGQSVIGSNGISVSLGQNKQQAAYQQFYAYWRNRTLFTVQSPWAVFQNMAIKSLRAIQDAETNVITDFEVQFKMIRVASTTTATPTLDSLGRLIYQGESSVNLGTSSLSPSATQFPFH